MTLSLFRRHTKSETQTISRGTSTEPQMPRRLRVLAGPSTSRAALKPLAVNSGRGADVSSDVFEGSVAVFVKGFNELAASSESVDSSTETERDAEGAYFGKEERRDVTWSIQVQGTFRFEPM